MIVQLGVFQFDTEMGYETLERVRDYQWAEVPIIGDYPQLQFTGKTMTMSFNGTYWNYAANDDRPQALEAMADLQVPLGLTDDRGFFYGFWVIVSLLRNEKHFRAEQKTGLRTDWNMELKYYGDRVPEGVRIAVSLSVGLL